VFYGFRLKYMLIYLYFLMGMLSNIPILYEAWCKAGVKKKHFFRMLLPIAFISACI